MLQKVQPGLDDFITEKYAEQIAAILAELEPWFAAIGEGLSIHCEGSGGRLYRRICASD